MKKILTIVLDGFGIKENIKGNAILEARNFKELWNSYPHSLLWASEEPIGLLKGQFGNSEVGHMTIGAGRKIPQNINRIHDFLDNDLDHNEKYLELINYLKTSNHSVHLMGLCSDGLVHADIKHFIKLYDHLVSSGILNIYFHLITDGRDTKTTDAYKYIKEIQTKINEKKVGSIATISGRYYAMDRDKKFDRTQKYYDAITKGIGISLAGLNIEHALQSFYKKNITDEFLPPMIAEANGTIKDGDVVIWLNYRTDRAKQILDPLVNKDYQAFPIIKYNNLKVYSFIPIDKKIPTINFLDDIKIANPLGIYLSKLGLTQARIAETEKYAHVTYFFDGEYDGPIESCTKILVPSLKIKTYDLDPRMSAVEVTKKVVSCMEKDIDFIFVNFANPDMVGHTGVYDATSKAIITVDLCLSKLVEEAKNNFYNVIITSDHGNADTMLDENNNPVTTHSLAKVPFLILDNNIKLKETGDLTNVAPTILEYMDIAKPKEMTGTSLIIKN